MGENKRRDWISEKVIILQIQNNRIKQEVTGNGRKQA